ncbi:MAG: hypothetical protein KJ961_07325, partial [Alphaproteobacteria bacterium]
SEEMEREDRAFVAKKLGLSDAEFDAIMNAERKTFWDYPSSERNLPGTPLYTTYIRAAHLHSGAWLRQNVARIQQRFAGLRALPQRAWHRLRHAHVDPAGLLRALVRFVRRTLTDVASGLLRGVMKLTVPLIRPVGNLVRKSLSPAQFDRFKSFARWLYAGGRISDKQN